MPLIASVIRTTAGESAHNTNHDLPLKERFSNNSLLMSRYSASLLSPLFSGCARLSAFGEASNTRRCRCLTGGLIGDTTSVPVMKGVVARTRQIPAEPQQWPAAAQVHRAGFCDNRQRYSGPSLCTRESACPCTTTMELVCGQGRLCLDKYASPPQRRYSYFHHCVWECKFMCVIPLYYISAPGQNENEYSHSCAYTHTHTDPFNKKASLDTAHCR